MLKVLVDYPTATEEFVIVERMIGGLDTVQRGDGRASSSGPCRRRSRACSSTRPSSSTASGWPRATRNPASVGLPDLARYVTYGVSPRASIYMVLAAQALALVRGRSTCCPRTCTSLAPDVLRHRLVLSYEALGDDVTPDDVVDAILPRSRRPTSCCRDASVARRPPAMGATAAA